MGSPSGLAGRKLDHVSTTGDDASPDGEPILGPGSVPGLYYAAGHTRNGILLTPISADAVSAAVLGRTPPVDLAPFSPARLGAGRAVR